MSMFARNYSTLFSQLTYINMGLSQTSQRDCDPPRMTVHVFQVFANAQRIDKNGSLTFPSTLCNPVRFFLSSYLGDSNSVVWLRLLKSNIRSVNVPVTDAFDLILILWLKLLIILHWNKLNYTKPTVLYLSILYLTIPNYRYCSKSYPIILYLTK